MALASGLPTWRALAAGLAGPAARAITVHAVVVTGAFLLGAWALHRAWFAGGSALVHGLGIGLFPLFAAAGALTGVGLGVTATLRTLLTRLEHECARQLGPLVRQALERALGGEPAVSLERFRAALDHHFRAVSTNGGWGPVGWLGRLLGGVVIRLVRFGLERQLLRPLEREGVSVVTLDTLERHGRDALIRLLLDQARARVGLAHAALLAVAGVATLGPLVILIRGVS